MSEYMEDNRITGNECEFTANKAREIIQEVSRVVVGQYDFIEKLVVSLFSGGHVLVEGVPGLAKTLASRVIAKTEGADFKRVQFTRPYACRYCRNKGFDQKREFYLKKGPLLPIYFLPMR